MRIFSLIIITFIISCDNYHEKSFNQLSIAFNNWYIKSIDSSFQSYYNQSEYNAYPYLTYYLINDFIQDLNRFDLELSQINSKHLSKKNKRDYFILNEKIKDLQFNYDILNVYKTDPIFYLEKVSYHFNYLFYSKAYSLEDKFYMLDLLINSTNLFLDQSKNLLKEVYSYELCKIKINNIVDDIENFLVVNNSIDKNTVLLNKTKNMFDDYLIWINSNTTLIDLRKDDDFYSNFIKYYFNEDLEDVRHSLYSDINLTFKKIFDLSLNIYLYDNDEPVWVDKSDTLDVINWSVEYSLNKYNEFDSSLKSLDVLDSLKIKETYTNTINAIQLFGNPKTINRNKYEFEKYFLNKELGNYFTYNIKNNDNYIYINRYFSNALIHVLLNHFIDSSNIKKDVNYKLLFYLNLYYTLNKVYCQDMYLNGEFNSEDILDEVSSIPLLTSKQVDQIVIESFYPYYFLKEYSEYKKISRQINEDKSIIKNRDNILYFINNKIFP